MWRGWGDVLFQNIGGISRGRWESWDIGDACRAVRDIGTHRTHCDRRRRRSRRSFATRVDPLSLYFDLGLPT
jgi:hypothetical protein